MAKHIHDREDYEEAETLLEIAAFKPITMRDTRLHWRKNLIFKVLLLELVIKLQLIGQHNHNLIRLMIKFRKDTCEFIIGFYSILSSSCVTLFVSELSQDINTHKLYSRSKTTDT